VKIESDKDFTQLREYISAWRKKFPMFVHDVNQIQNIVELHIQNYSIALVHYRQSRKINHLERAQQEIDAINRVLETVEKLELMALLAR
jgi:hypothetical protein